MRTDILVRTNGDSHKKNKSERLSDPSRLAVLSRELSGMESGFTFSRAFQSSAEMSARHKLDPNGVYLIIRS